MRTARGILVFSWVTIFLFVCFSDGLKSTARSSQVFNRWKVWMDKVSQNIHAQAFKIECLSIFGLFQDNEYFLNCIPGGPVMPSCSLHWVDVLETRHSNRNTILCLYRKTQSYSMLCCFSLFKRETVLRTIKCHFFPDENYERKTFVVKSFGERFRRGLRWL